MYIYVNVALRYINLVAVVQSEVPSECRLLTSYILLRLHDYHASEVAARKGQRSCLTSALSFLWHINFVCCYTVNCQWVWLYPLQALSLFRSQLGF